MEAQLRVDVSVHLRDAAPSLGSAGRVVWLDLAAEDGPQVALFADNPEAFRRLAAAALEAADALEAVQAGAVA